MNSLGTCVVGLLLTASAAGAQTFASRYFGSGRPDQEGRFKVRNLPPGEYYAVALDYVEAGLERDPEFLERVRATATEFTLTEGQLRTLDLKLVSIP